MTPRDKAFFRPLNRRILILLVCIVWSGLEWWGGPGFWSGLATLVTAYVVWTLFIRFDPDQSEDKDQDQNSKTD
ncbi:hypothetical protein E4656_10500 [Natronospirillum operosum]|uniref:DUF3329 domain-containing protein n=1 Tax=Natronospirillum operosum TaxID=2759953 RepID=A0A4Z0W8Y6_9GAMM|nr:hypothetical protein [Natronospirillum operosum]TGG93469.1 hypothetical protein E4656_10500 [Natronospirillum operosum]